MSGKPVFKGKLFEVEQTAQPDGRVFEVARRAPGVRLIIPNRSDGTVLLTREFRKELNRWDYRLPGGKVFDSLNDYRFFRETGEEITAPAESKAKAEAREETGLIADELKLFRKSTLGATVEWDLFVFEVVKWHRSEDGQQLEQGEQIEADNWFAFSEVEQMIYDAKMQEERIALILLQWLKQAERSI
jgi:8-oxo-dGTP pyrophosphatase MutT (NUDIX family)